MFGWVIEIFRNVASSRKDLQMHHSCHCNLTDLGSRIE